MDTRTSRTADKALNKKHAQILGELARMPCNRSCADCQKRDPRWASWNLGIFICIRCSGIHRSLGTHISKVKSIDLDCWTPEQVESMQRWGNERANAYWEANLKSTARRPTDYGLDAWIRSKYERRAFAMKGEMPAPETLSSEAVASAAAASVPTAETSRISTNTASNIAPVAAIKPVTTNLLDLMDAPIPSNQPTNSNNNNTDDLFSAFTSAPVASATTATSNDFARLTSTSYAPLTAPSTMPATTTTRQTQPQNDLFDLMSLSTGQTSTGQRIAPITAGTATSSTTAMPGQPDLSQPNQDLKSYILSLYAKPNNGPSTAASSSSATAPGPGRNTFGGF